MLPDARALPPLDLHVEVEEPPLQPARERLADRALARAHVAEQHHALDRLVPAASVLACPKVCLRWKFRAARLAAVAWRSA
jgi:hypothetical protein